MKLIEDNEKYLAAFSARARQLADSVAKGEVPAALASLDLITSRFSAKALSSEEMSSAYPVEDWRDHQITIPVAWLRPLVEGWLEYKTNGGKGGLDTALGLKDPGRGKSSAVKLHDKQDRDRRLSNLVIVDYVSSAFEGRPVSLDAVFEGVAAQSLENARTVERAYRAHGARHLIGFDPFQPKLPDVLAQAIDRNR